MSLSRSGTRGLQVRQLALLYVAIDQMFDFEQAAALDLEPDRDQRGAALHFDDGADRDLSGDGIGDVILESGGLGSRPPQDAFADIEQRGVFGETHVVGERQRRAVVLEERGGIAVHDGGKARAVAGLHGCRIPRRLGGAERDRQRGSEEKYWFHGSGTMVTRRVVRVNIKG